MTNPGYLGAAHKAFETGDPSKPDFAPKNLTLVTGVDNRRLDDRKHLLGQSRIVEARKHLRRAVALGNQRASDFMDENDLGEA